MPAREARLANAEVVAKAMHEYLASIEERAQKAELAAAEARIKAAEERRARRLTLALAGTIVGALALGGGALLWVNHERAQRAEEQAQLAAERAQRAEQTRTVVEAAYGESIESGRAGKPTEALAAARRALSLAETGDADAALLERAKNFVAKAEQDVGAAERERKLAEQDEKLRSRLIDLRLEQIATIDNNAREIELDKAFTQAFHDYGVDLEGDDLVPALKRIRERSIAAEVALALDDWGRLRRKVHGAKSEKAENLFLLAMDLDPEPGRKRMREAISANDLAVMLDLTAPENLPKLEPGSIFVLSAALWYGFPERKPDVFRILRQALLQYPGDYVLQAVTGYFEQDSSNYEQALACRAAAASLRPGDITARVKLAETLYTLGRETDAVSTLRACLAADASNAEALYLLGCTQLMLGDNAGGLASLTRSIQLHDEPDRRSDLHVAQYFNGILSREEFESRMANGTTANNLATYVYALVDHPDPKQRDPQLALRTLKDWSAMIETYRWPHFVETVARIRLEDWPGALSVIEHRLQIPGLMLMAPMCYDFMRSLIYSHVGRAAEARVFYERGMVTWGEQTAANPAAWDHSDAMRWRTEAEAGLAK
jgi:tetratricopeptide (TPR) repeat protein